MAKPTDEHVWDMVDCYTNITDCDTGCMFEDAATLLSSWDIDPKMDSWRIAGTIIDMIQCGWKQDKDTALRVLNAVLNRYKSENEVDDAALAEFKAYVDHVSSITKND